MTEAFDVLIPGDENWPKASIAVDPLAVFSSLPIKTQIWLEKLMLIENTDYKEIWERHESTSQFEQLLNKLYEHYYSSKTTFVELTSLSKKLPRDTEKSFDPTLLKTVLQASRTH